MFHIVYLPFSVAFATLDVMTGLKLILSWRVNMHNCLYKYEMSRYLHQKCVSVTANFQTQQHHCFEGEQHHCCVNRQRFTSESCRICIESWFPLWITRKLWCYTYDSPCESDSMYICTSYFLMLLPFQFTIDLSLFVIKVIKNASSKICFSIWYCYN